MRLAIPFIKSRGLECGQTCAAMMIKYFYPEFRPDFGLLTKIVHHKTGKFTFPLQNAILLDHFGVRAKCFSSDDISEVKKWPGIFKKWFREETETQRKFIDLPSYNWMVREGRRKKLFKKRKTSFGQIIKLFKKGYLVSFVIDWNTLVGKKGPYEGHFVILSGIRSGKVLIHDPDNGPFIAYPQAKIEKAYHHPAIADDVFVAFGRTARGQPS